MSRTDMQLARAALRQRIDEAVPHPYLHHEGCTGHVSLVIYRDRKTNQSVRLWRCTCGARAEVRT